MIMKPRDEKPKITRVALYCRVSTDKQACKEDSSLDTQRDRLVRYIEDKQRAGQNWQLAHEFVEGEEQNGRRKGHSGKDLCRPAFTELMAKVRARLVDVVVFTKMDRISRNVVDFLTLVEEFERHDVKLVSLKEEINTASASGRVMTTIMIALAQFEREQISERTREKMAWRSSKGLPIGPPPIGYEMHEKRYRVAEREAGWVRFIDSAYLKTRSLDKVARMAYERGIRSKNGCTLTKYAISSILRNPAYVGLISHNGETFKGAHEPIRDRETYEKILKTLDVNRRNGRGNGRPKYYDYLLQGLVLCGYCGGKMVPRTSLGRGGHPYHYYICSPGDKTAGIDCKRNYIDAVEADRYVLDYVKQLALRDDLVQKLCSDRDASFAEALRVARRDQDQVKERLAEIQREATNLVKAIARIEGPPETMVVQVRQYEREKSDLEAVLSRMNEEVSRLEKCSMRVDLAEKTVRFLADILEHPGVTPAHVKDCLPRFVNYVTWKKEQGAHKGRFEIALFERPFRADRERPLREVVEEIAGEAAGNGDDTPARAAGATGVPDGAPDTPESRTPRQRGAACGPDGTLGASGSSMGWMTGLEPATA